MNLKRAIVLIAFGSAVLASGFYFARRSGSDYRVYSNDFNVYYFASRELASGLDPYQNSLGAWTPYLYPPLLAELILPIALLPLPVAAYIWFLLSALSITLAAVMSAKLAVATQAASFDHHRPNLCATLVTAIGAVMMVARFVLDTFEMGQVNAEIAALSVMHLYLYSKGRKLASALVLALAASIKLTPAVIVLYHLAKKRVRFAAGCFLLVGFITLLSFVPLGTQAARAFVLRTIVNEQGFDLAYSGNQSLRGAKARLIGESSGESRKPADMVTLTLSIALLALSIRVAREARSELAAASPFFCCAVMLSPLSWKSHFVMLLLPAANLIWQAIASAPRKVVAVLIFAIFNLTSPKVIGLAAAEWVDAHSLIFVGALIAYVATVFAILSR
jgi:alpha-1,2-mannosyltransferase